jgi:4-hydroxy-tetrahydrodipicolinate reductase
MGREILALSTDLECDVVCGLSRSGSRIGDVPVSPSIQNWNASGLDVVIDFSLPESTPEISEWCAKNKKPLVSGVTGLQQAHHEALNKASASTAVFWAPNMSLGVAVTARMLREMKHLNGFDFQIEELHHNRKKDRPSGTALFLQDALKKSVGEQVPDPVAIRGGGIFGIHKIWAMGEEETITIEHTAMSRRVFARGALQAARWIVGKASGTYKMDDLLSLPSEA